MTDFPNVTTNVTTALDFVPPPPAPWWSLLIMVIIVIVTILANLMVIVSFIMEPRLREPFNYYLLNLAVNDFLVGCLGMTYYTIDVYHGYWSLGFKQCTLWIYFDFFNTSTSLMGIFIISLDRTWAVVSPISYKLHNSVGKSIGAIVLSVVIVHVCLVPSLAYERMYHGDRFPPHMCHWDIGTTPRWSSNFYLIVFTEWAPCLLTVICYFFTITKLGQIQRHRNRQIQEPSRGSKRARHERQANLLLTLLFVTLVIMWGPWFVYQALSLTINFFNLEAYITTYWIAYSMSAVNPFLFNVANDDVRRAFRKLALMRTSRVSTMDTEPSVRANQQTSRTSGVAPASSSGPVSKTQ